VLANTKGFTITELLIAVTLGSMLSITLFTVTIFFYGGVIRNDVQARLIVESQNVLRRVVEDLRTGSGVLVSNTIADTNEPSGGWTTSNTDLILIISTPSQNNTREFISDTLNGGFYHDEIIYYADGVNLYKRILANPNATGNRAKTTCPPTISTPSCPADRRLTENFADMNFVFYDQDDSITTDPTLARSVEILIEMEGRTLGQNLSIDNDIRVTMRNSR
jgi:prepilin-type N-terminal cleavage/methylation domain-containing protein